MLEIIVIGIILGILAFGVMRLTEIDILKVIIMIGLLTLLIAILPLPKTLEELPAYFEKVAFLLVGEVIGGTIIAIAKAVKKSLEEV